MVKVFVFDVVVILVFFCGRGIVMNVRMLNESVL